MVFWVITPHSTVCGYQCFQAQPAYNLKLGPQNGKDRTRKDILKISMVCIMYMEIHSAQFNLNTP